MENLFVCYLVMNFYPRKGLHLLSKWYRSLHPKVEQPIHHLGL